MKVRIEFESTDSTAVEDALVVVASLYETFEQDDEDEGPQEEKLCGAEHQDIVDSLWMANPDLLSKFEGQSLVNIIGGVKALLAILGPNLDKIIALLKAFGVSITPNVEALIKLIISLVPAPTPDPIPNPIPVITVKCSAEEPVDVPSGAVLVANNLEDALNKIGDGKIINILKNVDWAQLIQIIMTIITVIPK